MTRILLLTDRAAVEPLPALGALGHDVKTEPLSAEVVPHLGALAPSVIVVDAEENPEHAAAVLRALASARGGVPVVAVLARTALDRAGWAELADDFVFSGAPEAELRLRLAMLLRRTGGGGEAVLRLGPLAVNVDTYQVTLAGRSLDLTYKEFELLRFLVQRPGRVFGRATLLHEVWGYDFYGGTRTVDVHVRRLRAKFGAEHEGLIETVRGVGYRAASGQGGARE